MTAKVIVLAARRPQRHPEPPVNPGLELVAWSMAWWAEALHVWSAMLRRPR